MTPPSPKPAVNYFNQSGKARLNAGVLITLAVCRTPHDGR